MSSSDHQDGAPRLMSRQKNLFIAGTFIAAALYVGAMLLFKATHADWVFWIGLSAATLSVVLAFAWMAALDEVALRAHADSWLYGGLGGLAISALLVVAFIPALMAGGLESVLQNWRGHTDATTGFLFGFAFACVLPAIGTLAWWTVFWIRRR